MSHSEGNPPRLWWESLPDETECPITLEPINTLLYPPFVLQHKSDSKIRYYFDGLALASFIVSRGIFQNPLTRDPLLWDDCHRLDLYLDQYGSFSENGIIAGSSSSKGRRFQVLEAFALRESMHVRTPASDGRGEGVNQDSIRRRADFLRSEATVALSGLFTYERAGHSSDNSRENPQRHRQRRQNHHHQYSHTSATIRQMQPNPTFGFNLHAVDDASANNANDDDDYGMIIIDDDEQVKVESDQHAFQELQQAFPHLSTQDTAKPSSSKVPAPDERRLELIRQQAARDEQQALVRQQALQYAQQQLEKEAQQRKLMKQHSRQMAKLQAGAAFQREREEQQEIEKARNEIEEWRASQWERMRQLNEKREARKQERYQQQQARLQHETVLAKEQEENQQQFLMESQRQQEAAEKEAKQKSDKAAKRKRAKERKKQQKAQERQEQEQREMEAALAAERAAAATKCDACGGGIVGCGFEKFGHQFCSPKCARAGPSSS